jgi:hypothetical protein
MWIVVVWVMMLCSLVGDYMEGHNASIVKVPTLKMEVIGSSETLVTTQCHNPKTTIHKINISNFKLTLIVYCISSVYFVCSATVFI